MNVSFIVTIESEVVDQHSLLSLADDMHSDLDGNFDVVDVKPWARPTVGFTPSQTQPTGAAPAVLPTY